MSDHTTTDTQYKTCTKCGQTFPATPEYFYRQAAGKYGFNAQCKGCIREYDARPENKAKRKAYSQSEKAKKDRYAQYRTPEYREKSRERYRKNIDKRKAYLSRPEVIASRKALQQSEKYLEKDREYMRQRRLDPEFVAMERAKEHERARTDEFREYNRVKSHRRRALEARVPGKHTISEIRALAEQQKHRCWWCGKRLREKSWHIDHRIPLSAGGSNDISNIVIACPKCNMSKGSKMPFEWCGRLL